MKGPPSILMTEPEAARALSLSTRTLRKARRDGLLHYVLIGRAVRYTMDDLQSYVDSLRKVQPQCPPARPAPRSTAQAKPGGQIIPFTVRNASG